MQLWKTFADWFGKKYSIYVAIVGNLLGIFSGISIAWSSPVLYKLLHNKDNPFGRLITQDENDWIGSAFSIGGAVGPLILMYSLDLLGRKYTMTILAIIFPVFHIILAFSRNINLYYISRIALGVAVGGSFSILPIYITEISSMKMRGTYATLASAFILTGCLVSYSLAPFVSLFTFFFIIAVSSLLYTLLFVSSCPESLYFMMRKYGTEETLDVLKTLRTHDDIHEEMEEIRSNSKGTKTASFIDIFRSKAGRRAFFITTSLLILQQFCGVNVITTFTQQIFEDAKVPIDSDICTILFGAVQCATCLITPMAAKSFNRKLMLTISFAGVSVSNALMGSYFCFSYMHQYPWVSIVALLSFVIFYNCGLASLPWATLAELYPLNVKSVGGALSTTIYWIFQFILTYFFNKIDRGISFFGFSLICLLSIGFVKFFLIETRGKTLREIQLKLEG